MKTLKQYVNKKYAGNVSACARANGVTRQAVEQWLKAKHPFYVINGRLLQLKREIK